MLQSRNAVGNLIARYTSVLTKCRMLNVLGTCALAAMMAVPLAMPTEALADVDAPAISSAVETVDPSVTEWTSSVNIEENFTSTSGTLSVAGVHAAQSITMTLQSGHSITLVTETEDHTLFGMAADYGDSTLINNGTINLTANKEAFGMYVKNDNNTLTNVGTINVKATSTSAEAIASGMHSDNNNNDILSNSGTINAEAISTGSDATAFGMYLDDDKNTVTNSGTINVKATTNGNTGDATAYGMHADDDYNKLINSSTINVETTSTGGDAISSGMYGDDDNTFINNGTINSKATSTSGNAKAYGIHADDENNTVNNYGTIDVKATNTNGDAYAYGVFVEQNRGNPFIINNYGTINATATSANATATAYQLYLQDGAANIGTWTTKLGGASSYHIFGVGDDVDAVLNFGPDASTGATFVISGIGEGFESGTTYMIRDMVNEEGVGTVTGYIASVTSSYDFLEVELVDAGTTTDYSDQGIKGTLTTSSDNSPVQGAAGQVLGGVKGQMHNLGKILSNQRHVGAQRLGNPEENQAQTDTATMYADAGTTVSDAGGSYISPESPVWNAFLMPFYSTTSENGGAYDINMGGFVVGASRNVNDDFVLGFHASISKAESDSVYTDSEALSYALGVNGVYNIGESLYFRGQLTGFFAESDLDMLSSTSASADKASADMGTFGMYTELAAGYDIALTPQHILTPELGLSYMYAHMEGFDSAFGAAAFSMDSENYDALYADASVRWTGSFDVAKGSLKPTVKAGIRQALTDPETSSTMNIFGASTTTHADANDTSFLCEAGLAWEMDEVTISATYSGEFGNVEYSHMGMFKVDWAF